MSADSLSRSDIDGKLQKLEKKLDNLRRDYEQFFVGARDRPPTNERRQVERLLRELKQANIANTSQQFRMRGLAQRFTSYKQKWNRVERQIEQGTYKPHQKRAEDRVEDGEGHDGAAGEADSSAEAEQQDDDTVELDVDMEEVDLGDLEDELQELDEAGEFDKYDETEQLDEDDFQQAEREQKRRRSPERQNTETRDGQRRPSRSSAEKSRDAEDTPQRSSTGGEGQEDGGSGRDSDKLREIQDKLGLSGGTGQSSDGDSSKSGDDDRRDKLRSMREKLDRETQKDGGGGSKGRRNRESDHGSSGNKRRSNNTGGSNARPNPNENTSTGRRSSDDKPEADRKSSQRDSDRRDRVIERSSSRRGSSRRGSSGDGKENSDDDDETHAERIYDRFIATKHRHGESTEHLTFEAVRASMQKKRLRLAEREGTEQVHFQVVVKDEQVFLQPVFD